MKLSSFDQLRYFGDNFQTDWSILVVDGDDAEQFLHAQTTNDVKVLEENHFQSNSLLDISGKIDAYFLLLKENKKKFYIITSNNDSESIIERIEKFHITEEFEIKKYNGSPAIKFHGADEFKGSLFGLNCSIGLESDPSFKTLKDESFIRLKENYGFLGDEVQSLINNTVLIETAVSFTKGCYLGQETVAKVANNRGASKYPVALIENNNIKKIVRLKREERVEGKLINLDNTTYKVRLFPFLKNDNESLANKLFLLATQVFTENENAELAISYLERVLELNPEHEDACESLGVIFGRLKQFKKGIELMEALTKINPKSVMAHTNLSLFYMNIGEIEKAEEEKAIATTKTFSQFGDIAEENEAKEKRIKEEEADRARRFSMFQQVLEMDADDILANFGIGQILLEEKKFDESIKCLEKVLKLDPKHSVGYLTLSKAFIGVNKLEFASSTLEKGIEVAATKGDMMPANEMQSILNSL